MLVLDFACLPTPIPTWGRFFRWTYRSGHAVAQSDAGEDVVPPVAQRLEEAPRVELCVRRRGAVVEDAEPRDLLLAVRQEVGGFRRPGEHDARQDREGNGEGALDEEEDLPAL